MGFDQYNNFRGTQLGIDRQGHTTPSPDACDEYRPFHPVPYPAPWLPIKRRDEGHPVAAGKVLSEGNLVGVDKSGALIPAGYFCGTQKNGAVKAPTAAAISGNVLTLTVANKAVVGEQYVITDGTNAYLDGKTVTAKTGTDATKIVADFTHADAAVIDVTKLTIRSASKGDYCVVVYSQYDVGTVINPQSGKQVAAAGEYVVLAAPADGVAGDKITMPNGAVVTVTADDLTFAGSCDLIPGGFSKGIGFAVRDVFVYIGGLEIIDDTLAGGIKYNLLTQRPDLSQVTNYTHEMGTVYQTRFVLRLPWIGKSLTAIADLAKADGVVGYIQTDYSRSFVHFTGDKGNVKGKFFLGCSVVPSRANNGADAGNFAPYDPLVNDPSECIGTVLGVELMYPIRDYANRVRTQFERASSFVGPRMDPNPTTFEMGGSAAKGLDYAIHITTNGAFKAAMLQQKTLRDEYSTYVLVHVNCR